MSSKPDLAGYKILLYAQESAGWVAEIPAIPGCYALIETREEALRELENVFHMIRAEYEKTGKPLPEDRTELLVNAWRDSAPVSGRRESTRVPQNQNDRQS